MMMIGSLNSPVSSLPANNQPNSSFFLNSICPINQLDLNNRWQIPSEKLPNFKIFGQDSNTYRLVQSAINIPRTALLNNIDSNTYVSLPNSTWSKFKNCQKVHGEKLDGLIIGANVNGLSPDPFNVVHLNPGCITHIVENPLIVSSKLGATQSNVKKLFNNNIMITTNGNSSSSTTKYPKSSLMRNSSTFLSKSLTCDNFKTKYNNTKKFIITSHGRVFNILGISNDNILVNIEIPLMRITFHQSFITSTSIFTNPATSQLDIVLGFSSGDIIWINPSQQKYTRLNKNGKLISSAIISINWSLDGKLIFAGFVNGELAVFNRDLEDSENYKEEVLIQNKFMNIYTNCAENANVNSNPVAHYKLSKKAITMIKNNPVNKNLIGVTSDDGFTRLVDISINKTTDLIQTYFGGALCLDFSSDGKYLTIGGQDDLISIYELSYCSPFLSPAPAPAPKTNNYLSSALSSQSTMSKDNIITSVKFILRLKGHNSWIRAVRFVNIKNNTYKLCSVGDDGKLAFWEFSNKSLPKIKNLKKTTTTSSSNQNSPSLSNVTVAAAAARKLKQQHLRSRSTNDSISSYPSSAHLNQSTKIQNILTSSNAAMASVAAAALAGLGSSTSIINQYEAKETNLHRAISFKNIPIIIPLVSFELGEIYEDRKLGGFYVDEETIWVFGKNGDLIHWLKE